MHCGSGLLSLTSSNSHPAGLQIRINPKDRVLSISGDRPQPSVATPSDSSMVQRWERRFGSFKREVPLPDTVDTQAISAKYALSPFSLCAAVPWGHVGGSPQIAVCGAHLGCNRQEGHKVPLLPCCVCLEHAAQTKASSPFSGGSWLA